jgi:hypothetical protein
LFVFVFQEVERERDRERLESKRKLDGMKAAFEEEQEDTKKQITDLQVSAKKIIFLYTFFILQIIHFVT